MSAAEDYVKTVGGAAHQSAVTIISRLEKQLAERDAALARCVEFQAELENIVNAKPETWEDPNDFKTWAQNRERHVLANTSVPASAQATTKVQQWQPIETYDKLKRKPKLSVFWFKEFKPLWSNGIGLNAFASLDRIMGSRTCVLWMPLPEPPTEAIREEKEGK